MPLYIIRRPLQGSTGVWDPCSPLPLLLSSPGVVRPSIFDVPPPSMGPDVHRGLLEPPSTPKISERPAQGAFWPCIWHSCWKNVENVRFLGTPIPRILSSRLHGNAVLPLPVGSARCTSQTSKMLLLYTLWYPWTPSLSLLGVFAPPSVTPKF